MHSRNYQGSTPFARAHKLENSEHATILECTIEKDSSYLCTSCQQIVLKDTYVAILADASRIEIDRIEHAH